MRNQLIGITDREARESLIQDMDQINCMIDGLEEDNN